MGLYEDAYDIIDQLNTHGFEAYIVGGAVRDRLLDKQVNDIDIATNALPEDVSHLFDQVIPVGIEHGTVIVRHHHRSFEVTTYRQESAYTDSRRPDQVTFVTDIKSDLSRRDFTMNAMAEGKDHQLIDPFGGIEDLKYKRIKAVGNPFERFEEDPLRMMRALRFSAQLGFEIEMETKAAMIKLAHLIESVSIERVQVELDKLFFGKGFLSVLDVLKDVPVLNYLPVFKEKAYYRKHILKLSVPLRSLVDVMVWLHFSLNEPQKLKPSLKAYRLSNVKTKEGEALIYALMQLHYGTSLDWIIYGLDTNLIKRFIGLASLILTKELDYLSLLLRKQALPIQSLKDLAVKGSDILALFPERKSGPWVSQYLRAIEKELILGDLVNDKEPIEEWVMWYHQQENV